MAVVPYAPPRKLGKPRRQGRPPIDPLIKRINISVTITPKVWAYLQEQGNVSHFIETAVIALAKTLKAKKKLGEVKSDDSKEG